MWHDIPGYPGYQMDENGEVRNARGRIMLARRLRGRRCYSLEINGKGTTANWARLWLSVFVRPPQPGEYARHLDDDLMNEAPDNLAWGTPLDNIEDAKRNGGHARCIANSVRTRVKNAKVARKALLDEEAYDAIAARWNRRAGRAGNLRQLAAEYGIPYWLVYRRFRWPGYDAEI